LAVLIIQSKDGCLVAGRAAGLQVGQEYAPEEVAEAHEEGPLGRRHVHKVKGGQEGPDKDPGLKMRQLLNQDRSKSDTA